MPTDDSVKRLSREKLIDHVVEVIADSGMNGLSVRAVASRAGVAIGTVQHWFPTKTEMLLAAMERITQIGETAGPIVKAPEDPVAQLHGLIGVLVPSDSQSRVSRVWLAFAAQAAADDRIRARYGQLWAGVHSAIARLLGLARPAASAGSIEEAASELLALTDGLAVSVITEPQRMPAERARALATRRLDEVLAALASPHH